MVYFVVFWTTTGQTPGARIMEFRVVPTGGDKLKPWRAVVRAVGLALAAIPLFAVAGSRRSRDATSPEDAQAPHEPDQGAPSAHQNADPSGPHRQ